ncbi:hypothetical protein [Sphingomonas sp.]|jgi:hypothetical protein
MADPDTGTSDKNISTEHQEEGDARRPSDLLDRDRTAASEDDGAEKIGRG